MAIVMAIVVTIVMIVTMVVTVPDVPTAVLAARTRISRKRPAPSRRSWRTRMMAATAAVS